MPHSAYAASVVADAAAAASAAPTASAAAAQSLNMRLQSKRALFANQRLVDCHRMSSECGTLEVILIICKTLPIKQNLTIKEI